MILFLFFYLPEEGAMSLYEIKYLSPFFVFFLRREIIKLFISLWAERMECQTLTD